MSTDTRSPGRAATRAVWSVVVASSAWVHAAAAEVDFRPAITFGVLHDGNTAITGNASSNGDELASLAVDLSVSRRTPGSRLSFSYRPSYTAYRKASGPDYFGQWVTLEYGFSRSRQATYTLDLTGSRTEQQGVRIESPSEPTTFVPRSTQTRAAVGFRGGHEQRRSFVDWGIHADLVRYSQSSATGGAPSSTTPFEDSTSIAGTGAWRYAVTEKGSVGLGLEVREIGYTSLATTYVESLALIGAQAFDRMTSMTYSVGVSHASSSEGSATGVSGDLAVTHTITDVSSLSAGVRRLVSQGLGVGGASTDTGGYLAYAHRPRRRGLSGSVVAAYWKRQPENLGAASSPPGAGAGSDTNTLSTRETLAWSFNPFVSLEIVHAFNDQTSPDPAILDTRYNSYGFTLHWAIRGRQESQTDSRGGAVSR